MKKYCPASVLLVFLFFLSCKSPLGIEENVKKTDKTPENFEESGVVRDNLVAYWDFNDKTGTDRSGNGNTANVKNNPDFIKGIHGLCVELDADGINPQFIELPEISFDSLREFTLTMWVKDYGPGTNDNAGYFFYGDFYSGWMGIIRHNDYWITQSNIQYINFAVGADTAGIVPLQSLYEQLDQPEWKFYVIKYSNDYTYAEINNSNVDIGRNPRIQTPVKGIIGGIKYGNDLYHGFNGCIDDVRLYNRILEKTELDSLYNVYKYE